MSAARLAVTALLAGGAQALALSALLPGPLSVALQLLSLAWLAHLLRSVDVRRATLAGWLFATAWLAGSFWWLFISMHTYGGLHALLSALAVLALAAFLALYYGAAAAVFARLRLPRGAAWALAFAALWTLAELARARLFTGFPWAASGYAHVDGMLAPLAPWVGVYGIGCLAALIAALLASAFATRRARCGALALALLVLPLALPRPGADAADALPPMHVQLMQGNIPQDEKFIPGTGIADSLAWYGTEIMRTSAPLVVAPETAIPVPTPDLPAGYLDALRQRFSAPGQALLLGLPLQEGAGFSNAALGLAPGQSAPYRYDKHHLVPFGEFIPPLFKWFVRAMNIPLGDFDRGALRQPPFAWQGQLLAPNICYEDVFGEELAARFLDPSSAPTAFVNMSNIAWFADSNALQQHLAMSRMRTLEFARPMLRATNTGVTAIIDASGRVTHSLPPLTRAVLEGEFTGRTVITPYARWAARFGVWPLVVACAACVLICALMAKRRTYLFK
ncbi:MAG: apolipoprotein N-acyltransferase [Ottowia sp.]|nr:apolipoprotein N-acyltransferase [Ottowia sp.]